MRVAITGHRPERLKGQERQIEIWIEYVLKSLVKKHEKICLISGMARGIDQMAALVAIRLDIPIECYFGYRHKLSPVEQYIVENAAGVRYEVEKYQDGCFLKRDRRMVDDCDIVMGVWDGVENGGTYYTLKYAQDNNKEIILYDV